MFTKPVILIIIGIILFGLLFAGCSKYRFHKKSPEDKAEWVVNKITDELDLNDTQQAELNKIKSEVLAKHKDMHGIKSDVWNEVHEQLQAEAVDQQKLNDLLAGKEAQFTEMRSFAVSKFAQFHAILTAEQKKILSEKMNKIHKRWKH